MVNQPSRRRSAKPRNRSEKNPRKPKIIGTNLITRISHFLDKKVCSGPPNHIFGVEKCDFYSLILGWHVLEKFVVFVANGSYDLWKRLENL